MPLLISSASSDVLDGLNLSDEAHSELESPSIGSMDLCCCSTSSSIALLSKVGPWIGMLDSTIVEISLFSFSLFAGVGVSRFGFVSWSVILSFGAVLC